MKKALSAVLAVVLVLGVCFSVPMIASANDTDPFTYELVIDDETKKILGYEITGVKNGVTGPVEIPATYQPAEDVVLFPPTDPAEHETAIGEIDVTAEVTPGEEVDAVVIESVVVEEVANAKVTITVPEGYVLSSVKTGETSVALNELTENETLSEFIKQY